MAETGTPRLARPIWASRGGGGAPPPRGPRAGGAGPDGGNGDTTAGKTYLGEQRRAVALPLGGIGTGNVAIGATGVLKQWQLHHQGNHLGFLPQSFFALRLSC